MRLFFVIAVCAVGFGLAITAPAAAQEAENATVDTPTETAEASDDQEETIEERVRAVADDLSEQEIEAVADRVRAIDAPEVSDEDIEAIVQTVGELESVTSEKIDAAVQRVREIDAPEIDGSRLDAIVAEVEAIGQTNDGGQEQTETPTPTPTPEAEASIEGDEIVVRNYEESIDRDVTLESWSYNTSTERFTFDIYVQNRTRLYITEALSVEESGSARISVFNERMSPGRTQISFQAREGASGEAQAVLQTPRSQAQGNAVLVSTGYVPDQLPFSSTNGTTGWIGGVLTMLGFTGLAGVHTVRNLHSEPQDVK